MSSSTVPPNTNSTSQHDDRAPGDVVADALQQHPELLDLTLDQLRTLAVVHLEGNALQAARRLGREQSSVQKQLDNLNRSAQRLCGEPLLIKQGRGQNFLVTPTGEHYVRLALDTLDTWQHGIQAARRRLGHTITVGTTEFTVAFVGHIWPRVRDEFHRRDIELKISHIRTRDFAATLDSHHVDLICGSLAVETGTRPDFDYDVIEWHREGVALLTNLTTHELPDAPVQHDKLAALPLLAPTAGLLADFLRAWYGPDYRSTLNVIADIDALGYGLALLDNELQRGCLLTTENVARAATEGRLQGGHHLRALPLGAGYTPPMQIMTGIFSRRQEREKYSSRHPLNLLWNAFKEARPGTNKGTTFGDH
ncbi:LysR family transcriptional regulator [Saccharopolyspora gregorii]|uniref:LysR family transcriptional regulator n=1 Tax=Saccharopolyspora gregorii TaxID=33914 RepID=UPI0021AC6628|nr:LysR family transcriptional regulator [Saccharopolyspora gregorii]